MRSPRLSVPVLIAIAVLVAIAVARTGEIRQRAEAGLGEGMPAREAALARGFVLGDDGGVDEATKEDFIRSGLSHLLAVSGENVTLLALLAMPVLAAFGIPMRERLVWLLGLIAVYVPLAGSGPSIQRAGVMGALGLLATLQGRRTSRLYALGLAAVVTLAIDPSVAGDVGWQLSFAAVLGILLLAAPIRDRVLVCLDLAASALARRDSRSQRPVAAAGGHWRPALADGIGVTVAASLATAPLIAYVFEEFSVTSLAANVLVLPAVPPAMWLGMISAALAQVPGIPLASLNGLDALLLAYVAQVAAWCGRPSWAVVHLHISLVAMLATYAATAVCVAAIPLLLRTRRLATARSSALPPPFAPSSPALPVLPTHPSAPLVLPTHPPAPPVAAARPPARLVPPTYPPTPSIAPTHPPAPLVPTYPPTPSIASTHPPATVLSGTPSGAVDPNRASRVAVVQTGGIGREDRPRYGERGKGRPRARRRLRVGRRPRAGRRAPGRPRLGRRAGVAIGAAALVLFAVFVAASSRRGAAPATPPPGLRIDVLDVGQGDAILLQPRNAPAVLVDGGPPGDELVALLHDEGVERLGAAVVTHDQSDHAAGIAEALGRLPISRLVYRRLDRDFLAAARADGVRPEPVAAGTALRSGPLHLEVIWPPPELLAEDPPDTDPNLLALVIRARWHRFTMLLTADAEAETTPLDPGPIDVLKVAHHGSDDAGLGPLLDRIRPRLAVISVGADNSYGHPTPGTLKTLAEHGVPTLRTDLDGTVEIDVRRRGFSIDPPP